MSNSQDEVIAFLSCPGNYPGPEQPVICIESHGSRVFLHADRAYKLKLAVAYAALDFLTLERREQACRAELRLNSRTAPDLYLRLCPITRQSDGQLAFDGDGQVVDWLVVMRRFPQEALFDRMAVEGRLSEPLITELGAEIARFHASAEVTPAFGRVDDLAWEVEKNHREMCRYPQLLAMDAVNALYSASRSTLDGLTQCLEQRRREGRVRRCHGDLRLANICLYNGHPTLFDGIEFSERIACIDRLYDVAFVLMDLDHHGLHPLAVCLLNSYLQHGDMKEDCRPLAFFLSLRAATRSFSLANGSVRQQDCALQQLKADKARQLLRQAQGYLNDESPRPGVPTAC